MFSSLFKLTREKVAKRAIRGQFIGKNLSGLDLSSITFSKCDFRGANLTGVNISGCKFSQCEFKGANTEGVDFRTAKIVQCDGLSFENHKPRWFDWSEEQKNAIGTQVMQQTASVLGGEIYHDADEETIELRTLVGNRPTRIVVDLSFGGLEVELRFANTIGVLGLHYDLEKEPRAAGGSAWDQNQEVRHFVAPGVYIEEYPAEAEAAISIAQRFSDIVGDIAGHMPGQMSRVTIDADRIELDLKPELGEISGGMPEHFFPPLFGLLERIALVFESGQSAVAAKPRLYIRGQAVHGGGPITCPYCHTVVNLTEHSHCPNCGGAVQLTS